MMLVTVPVEGHGIIGGRAAVAMILPGGAINPFERAVPKPAAFLPSVPVRTACQKETINATSVRPSPVNPGGPSSFVNAPA